MAEKRAQEMFSWMKCLLKDRMMTITGNEISSSTMKWALFRQTIEETRNAYEKAQKQQMVL